MRHRIVVAIVAVLGAALVAFVVPLAVAVRGLLVSRALDELQAQTERVAILIEDQAANCRDLETAILIVSRQAPMGLSLFSRVDGRLLRTVPDHQPTVGDEVARAVQGAAGRRYGQGSLAVAVPLSTDVCGPPLVLHAEQSRAAVVGSIRRAWLALALVGAAVLALAAAAGRWVAGRLARPLQDLSLSAAALGDGDFSVRTPRSGMPEVDAIAETLDRTAVRLGRAVDRGRTFAEDASHQLRTPLTALRLHLEGLEATGAAPAEVEAALLEADRLEATVDELVALTSLDTAEETIEPAALVEPPVEAARVAARAAGRELVLEVVPSPPVRSRPAAIRQALQVLLDNALVHGRGTVTVRVAATLPDERPLDVGPGQGVRICVLDEGEGPSDRALDATLRARDRGTALPLSGGRGLALARTLVEGEGGRLRIDGDGSRTFPCLVLPTVTLPAEAG